MRTATAIALALLTAPASAQATKAYIIDGSGYFGAPGIQIGSLAEFDLADPSNVTPLSRPAHDLRFGGADVSPVTGDLVGFENSTNSIRVLSRTADQQTLIDSIGWMESGVAGFTFSNDGSKVYTTTAVGGFARIVEADAATGAVLSVHNILTNPLSSLATVPPGHPTLPEGEIVGLALTGFGTLNFVRLDLDTNSVVDEQSLTGIGFNPQFETGLDFAADGTLYALIQGYRQLGPDTFEEVSSHLYTLNPTSGALAEIGVVQADLTWDGVCLALADGPPPCPADLDGNGALNIDDINLFAQGFVASDPIADIDANGSFNIDDINLFAAAFTAGCP